MYDIHSHLLPGVDDGSQSVEESVGVLELMADVGVKALVLTPHVTATNLTRDADAQVEWRTQAFGPLAQAHGSLSPQLHLGFEIMLDQPLRRELLKDSRIALVGSRYILVEFPYEVIPDFVGNVLTQMVDAGVVPIVAHPERYHRATVDDIMNWRMRGAKTQIDATEMTRATKRGRVCRSLLKRRAADLVAADNHGSSRTVANAVDYLTDHGAEELGICLAEINPKAVIDDGPMIDPPPVVLKAGIKEWWGVFRGR